MNEQTNDNCAVTASELENLNAVEESEQLRVEFQKAVEASAENRAASPFQTAAMGHARLHNAVAAEIDNLTSADLKRVIRYMIGYPFYVKEFEASQHVTNVAMAVDRLIQYKNVMTLCVSLEREARVDNALAAEEAKIQKLDPSMFDAARAEMSENLDELGLVTEEQKRQVLETGQIDE